LWCEEKLRCGENWAASVWVPPKFGGFPPLSKLCPKRARCAIGASCPHRSYKLYASQLTIEVTYQRSPFLSKICKGTLTLPLEYHRVYNIKNSRAQLSASLSCSDSKLPSPSHSSKKILSFLCNKIWAASWKKLNQKRSLA
jgi:hypothetical protein